MRALLGSVGVPVLHGLPVRRLPPAGHAEGSFVTLSPRERQLVLELALWGEEYAPSSDLRAKFGVSSGTLRYIIDGVRNKYGESAIELAPGRGYRLHPKVLAAASR